MYVYILVYTFITNNDKFLIYIYICPRCESNQDTAFEILNSVFGTCSIRVLFRHGSMGPMIGING